LTARRKGKALVFGDDTRSFLATVRSLARKGVEVHAAPFDFRSPALVSRYIARIHWLPYYLQDGAEWLEAVRALLEAEKFDLMLPCDERALLPLHRHRDILGASCRLALPNDHALDVLYDKHRTRELAKSLGIPIAPGRLIAETDTAEQLIAEAGLPLVIKPCRSYALPDLYARGRVTIAENKQAIETCLRSTRGGMHFFEGFFPGDGVGVSVLASGGKLLQAFEHHRVHERAGSSYYRVSATLTPSLVGAADRIVGALDYTGLAMFEFKVNRQNSTWILLEVNARPWGSLPLPVGLGVDFPYGLFRLLVEGTSEPARDYRIGVHARNFVPDVLSVLAEVRDMRGHPLRLFRFLAGNLLEYGRVVTGREFHDVLTLDDPVPGLSEISDVVGEVGERVASRLPGALTRRKRRDRHTVLAARQRAATGRFKIVFVCQGNVCRSPFAAFFLRRQLETTRSKVDSTATPACVEVASAGMLPRAGVASPASAIDVARSMGVDLGPHRSVHLSRNILETADIVVVFDKKNLRWLRRRYLQLDIPVVFLGSFVENAGQNIEMPDPDGGDSSVFQRSYAEIAEGVSGLLSVIRGLPKTL
jgi:protein-tyrosine-phosphatase/predicted ATP-grasp superfamily ATP-dependent carboligase